MPYLYERYRKTVEQAMEDIGARVYTPCAKLKISCYVTQEPIVFAQRMTGRRMELQEGDKWAEHVFDCAWFHFEGIVPPVCEGKKTALLLDVGGEGLVVDERGEPVQGITCVDSQYDYRLGKPGKRVVPLAERAQAGRPIDLWVDGAANDLFGHMKNDGRIQTAQVALWDERLFSLFYDMACLVDYLKCSNEKTARYKQILCTLYDACCQTDHDMALERAAHALLSQSGGDAPLRFTAIGHAHMDLGWLWPIRETKRKGARTFATALSLMERYPDYVFGASQPQLFAWMKEGYPGLYARIKDKVREGQIEPQGCMWVEADTNLSGGEALVRQILYGKTFFREEFGVDVKTLWLPDVFGYTAALPQILAKSGCLCFMTQKLSWSQFNKFPHHTFRWKGIDGTEIFTHMLPEETYNSPMLPRALRFAEENYEESGIADEALMLFGIGDGGGGPGMEHLEAAKRVKNLYGLCPANQGQAEPMLLRLREKTFDRLPVWAGELYLERHQGTYTTAARSKRMNRLMEHALREAELAAVLTGDTPKAELDAIWKEVLLYQFHDILPGSSISRVYDESLARYAALHQSVTELTNERLSRLCKGDFLFNSLSWPRSAIVQREDGLYRVRVPAMGYTCERGEKLDEFNVSAGSQTLENRFLRAVFDRRGALIECFDKRNRCQTLRAPSGQFAVWKESSADCWDIAIQYADQTPEAFALETQTFSVEGGRAICRQRFAYGASTIDASISLGEDDEALLWDVRIDWQEQDVMLRTAFHTNVIAERAGFDIQYGLLHRSNHENTLWDKAQFEVCAHKWVDISESGRGVALLNDCKYGFRVKNGTIDMNLLRAQHYPSDLVDKGMHTLRYALYPHAGNEREGRVKEAAYELNMPVRLIKGRGASAHSHSLACARGVIIEAVKPAQDGHGFILRAYEPYGTRAIMHIALDAPHEITPCDMMENPNGEAVSANAISGEVKPFEICSWRLVGRH